MKFEKFLVNTSEGLNIVGACVGRTVDKGLGTVVGELKGWDDKCDIEA